VTATEHLLFKKSSSLSTNRHFIDTHNLITHKGKCIWFKTTQITIRLFYRASIIHV